MIVFAMPRSSHAGGIDSDHGVHGMVLGLDGKLYFTQGDGCCSVQKDKSERQQNFDVIDKSGRHVSSDQLANTLRANRDGTEFEVICDRQRNNYETCLNAFSNIFTSDTDDDGNRGCRVIWAMDGGRYGYHTPGSPRHWGEDVPGNVPKLVGTGTGSPAGIMVYEGNLLPEERFGSVLKADAGTRQVNFFPLTRKGAAYRTEYTELVSARDFPLGLRREALRALAEHQDGGQRIIELASDGKLLDDLETEAVTLLITHRDRPIRDQAAKVLPMPRIADGRVLPPVGQLLRRNGDPDKGRAVFFRTGQTSCASCHRVQGQGQWVGPDLSTIGAKYGKDELLRSILNPSAAIGYSFRSLVLALTDGRTITGLAVEDTPDRLVVKTADGQRITIRPGDIEDRKTSDMSLMPEGLAQTMSDQQLVDLLAYLSTLRRPVSIAGQYHVIGPLTEPGGEPDIDPDAKIDLGATVRGPRRQVLAWRRLDANAEGLADLTAMVAGNARNVVYAYTPVTSPIEQRASLVVETHSNLTVWSGGKPVITSSPTHLMSEPRGVEVTLPKSTSTLLIGLNVGGRPGGQATLVTTIVSAQPVSFTGGEASLSARR